jgi:hypothetical protein
LSLVQHYFLSCLSELKEHEIIHLSFLTDDLAFSVVVTLYVIFLHQKTSKNMKKKYKKEEIERFISNILRSAINGRGGIKEECKNKAFYTIAISKEDNFKRSLAIPVDSKDEMIFVLDKYYNQFKEKIENNMQQEKIKDDDYFIIIVRKLI